jgi:hypothetical protein
MRYHNDVYARIGTTVPEKVALPAGVGVYDRGAWWVPHIRVLSALRLTHDRFDGWVFGISVALDDGTVWGLDIGRSDPNEYPPDGGITKRRLLEPLPLDDLVTAARRIGAAILDNWNPTEHRLIQGIDDAGNVLPGVTNDMHPSDGMLDEWRAISAGVKRRAGARTGRYKEVADLDIVNALAAYVDWTKRERSNGETKSQFLARYGISSRSLDNYKRLGIERGFFEGTGQRGRPSGRLTTDGQRILERQE